MHEYLVKNSQQQPPSYVNQMAPAQQGQIDPRMIKQMLEQMGAAQNAPMSATDGINITISIEPQNIEATNYTDTYLQQAERFSKTPLARAFTEQEEIEIPIDDRSRQVKCGATKMLEQAIQQQMNPGMMVVEEHYTPFLGNQRRIRWPIRQSQMPLRGLF